MPSDSLTLSQFQQLLGNSIRMNRDIQNVWVEAEFSDLRVVGGHCYMELIEKDTAGTTRAKIRAMIWAGTLGAVRTKFQRVTGRDISSGIKVRVRGSATHHNLYGLSFTISDIDPSYTLGDMERVRREILDRLTREGIVGRNRQLQVTQAPQRIAVISAEGAAGYGDFMNQLGNNPYGFIFYTLLFPAVLQGERTAPSVIHVLDLVEQTSQMAHWDAVIIIRGGGATTDLNGFDNYELAKRVATFPIPVIVGIGHERDRTVLDEIACVRCKTPTAVAAFLIDSLRKSYDAATDLVRRITQYGTEALRGEHLRLGNLSQIIPATASNRLLRSKMQLERCVQSIPNLVSTRVMRRKMQLGDYANMIGRDIDTRISSAANALSAIEMKLGNDTAKVIENEQLQLQRLGDMLRLLNPENTLRRGYSITRVNGKAVRDASEVKEGDLIETRLLNGKIISKPISN